MRIPSKSKHSADVLIVGGSLDAVKLACDLASAGRSVFLATPRTYLGDDVCAPLDLQSPHGDAFRAIVGDDDGAVAPASVKAAADKALLDAGVDFRFQYYPVALRPDGAVFATRAGLVAVTAKLVIDSLTLEPLARAAGIPRKPFVPGLKRVTAYAIGGAAAPANCTVEKLPLPATDRGREFPCFKITGEIEIAADGYVAHARAANAFRAAMWTPETVALPDEISIDRDDGPIETFGVVNGLPFFSGKVPSVNEALDALKSGRKPAEKTGGAELDFREALSCDVLVAGGGTGGAAAVISAAREGARTMCIESNADLGGIMTSGRISRYWFGRRVGFAHESDVGTDSYAPDDPRLKTDAWYHNGVHRAHWFLSEALRANAAMLFDSIAFGAEKDGGAVRAVYCATPFGACEIKAGCIVDATGNGDVAAAAGAETIDTLAIEPAVQGAGVCPVELGQTCSNNDFTFVIDGDADDTTRAFVTAHVKHSGAFDVATILGTRERRRIRGDIVLTPADFLARRRYRDTVCVAESNFDTHGYTLSPIFMITPPSKDPREADIPLRALTPAGLSNVLVTGLAVSADRDAMPLIRMQADVLNQGHAAGLIAARSAKSGLGPRDLDISEIQRRLIRDDCVPARVLDAADSFDSDACHADALCATAALFADTARALPNLRGRVAVDARDTAAAQALAFCGDTAGREALLISLIPEWDEGWDYRGMGQFGRSASVQDASLIALSRIGGCRRTVLRKLAALTSESAFSHIRAVSLALMAHPDREAAGKLRELLSAPGLSGNAVTSLAKGVADNPAAYHDVSQRNAQLREIYLAGALHACDPADAAAASSLRSYAEGMQGAYRPFALAALAKRKMNNEK